MATSLGTELRYLLAAAEHGMPQPPAVEKHLLRRPQSRRLPDDQEMRGYGYNPTKIALDSAIREVWLDYGRWSGCEATLFVTGTLDEVLEIVGPMTLTESRAPYISLCGSALVGGRPVAVEAQHQDGRVNMIKIGFDRIQGRFGPVPPPAGKIRLDEELLMLLALADGREAPIVAADVVEYLRPRAVAITTPGQNLDMPWWAEQTGGDEYFVELGDSVVCGMAVEDESRGWGCWIEMYCAYGAVDEIELVFGALPERGTINPGDFSGRETYLHYPQRGAFDMRIITKVYKNVVATVHVEFPPSARK